MKSWIWLVLAVLGLALMVIAYQRGIRTDPQAPWARGFLCIGKGEVETPLAVETHFSTRLRLLPAGPMAQALIESTKATKAGSKAFVEAELRPRLIELPAGEMGLLTDWLREGRMPEPGENEVLAGAQCTPGAELSVAGTTLKVVGTLQPSVALFANSYLAPAHASLDRLFADADGDVHPVEVVSQVPGQGPDREAVARVLQAYPASSFTIVGAQVRPEPKAFLAYLAGQALFLLAGSGLLIGLYRLLAGRSVWPVLSAPLQELARRPRLLWGVHLLYFGLFVLGALVVYSLPDLQRFLMSEVQGQIRSEGKGVLAIAGRAYETGNILYAAIVTFVINFFLGSLAMITLPSLIIPGVGGLLAFFRATLWGVLLGPSEASLARMMIPHTGTLLLEGEGYILAAFFALLVPFYLFGSGGSAQKPDPADEGSLEPLADVPPVRRRIPGPFRQRTHAQPQGQRAGGRRPCRGGLLRGSRSHFDGRIVRDGLTIRIAGQITRVLPLRSAASERQARVERDRGSA